MKKERLVFVVDVHSFIDVITNSSTELFVVESSHTIKAIKEILVFMLKHWNAMAAKGIFSSYYRSNDIYDAYGKKKPHKPIYTFKRVFGDIYVYTQEMYEINKCSRYIDNFNLKKNIGKIFITSNSDNSIPYEMFDWIESAFSAERFHLG